MNADAALPLAPERMSEEDVRAIFRLARIKIKTLWRLGNGYTKDWDQWSPWWLVSTPYGLIQIGWRKRVINIDWSDTPAREVVTSDEVTKDVTSVHAYGEGKAVDYLSQLKSVLRRMECVAKHLPAGET